MFITLKEYINQYQLDLYISKGIGLSDAWEGKTTAKPTSKPTAKPTAKPTSKPTAKPTAKPTSKPTAKPTIKPTAKASEWKVLARELDASEMNAVFAPDNALMQDMVSYCEDVVSYDRLKEKDNHNVRDYKGDKAGYDMLKAYVDMLRESHPYLKFVEHYEFGYKTTTLFSFGFNYTGNVNLGSKVNQTHTENMCDVMIFGSIERSSLKFTIYTPKRMEVADLGMRYRSARKEVSIGGPSALSGLYRNDEGVYATSDGRLKTSLGHAQVLYGGKTYTAEATFDRDKKGGRDRVWIRNFTRNATLHFSHPSYQLDTGDFFRLQDLQREEGWLLSDKGVMDKESDFTGSTWKGYFLGACHNDRWITPVNTPGSWFEDANVRVMYMDDKVAVYYLYGAFPDAPSTMEALCAVSLQNSTSSQNDLITYTGQTLTVKYEGSVFDATGEGYRWEIISGKSLATLQPSRGKSCTLKAEKPGTVVLRVTYEYNISEPDVLTGRPRKVPKTKTKDFTILIQ